MFTRSMLTAIGAASLLGSAAHSRTQPQAGTTFVEIGAGAATTHTGSFEFINPNGGQYITTFPNPPFDVSKVVGNDIILDRQRRDASSPTGEVTIGRFLGNALFVRATYRYLGRYHFSGSAAFPVDPNLPALGFDQDYYLRGHGFYAGVGYEKNFAPAVFMDLSVEAGAASLHSVSLQGANLGDPLGHPPRTVTRFSGGAEIGLGVHMNRSFDLIVKARGDWLGNAQTGVSIFTISPDGNFGLNPDEQLKLHKLSAFGAGIALRTRF